MTAPTLGLNELRAGAHKLSSERRQARRDYERYAEQAAEADRDYRRALASEFAKRRADGESATAAEIAAQAEASEHKLRRDIATSLAKSSLLKVEECERDSATLRSIADWSRQIDGNVTA